MEEGKETFWVKIIQPLSEEGFIMVNACGLTTKMRCTYRYFEDKKEYWLSEMKVKASPKSKLRWSDDTTQLIKGYPYNRVNLKMYV